MEGIENIYFVYLKTAQADVWRNATYADLPQESVGAQRGDSVPIRTLSVRTLPPN
jgi:hypothetical protein